MTAIEVTCDPIADGWTCHVRLSDHDGTGVHTVQVPATVLERLDPAASAPDDLVRRSFEFLLEREPRGSILREFDLPVIGRYFPDYERTIRG